jgi:6-phospho-beta-glucosidase
MSGERIAIIGGGSPYVPGILSSLAESRDALADSEVVLMDVDPSRLPMMGKLGQRMIDEAGGGIAIMTTTDLRRALDGATFVLSNFRPGGLEGLRLDETIPDKYGVIGQETTGPGGTAFALRSIPQMLDLCRAMENVCAEAWLINYVNPTNFVADAVRRESGAKCISICDGGGNDLRYSLPARLDLDREDVQVRAIGVNHHAWLTDFRVCGEDRLDLLRERPRDSVRGAFEVWALERLGVFPANAYYLYPYFHYDDALANFRNGESLYNTFMADIPEHWTNFEAMAEGRAPVYMDPSKHHTDTTHGDLAVQIMLSIAGNEPEEFHVNLPNDGCVTNLPQGAIVEVPVLIDRTGVQPLCMGELPKSVLGLTQSLIAWQELSVDAALSGDRDVVVQAFLAHPWLRSADQAEEMCDELLAAHAEHLPQFG